MKKCIVFLFPILSAVYCQSEKPASCDLPTREKGLCIPWSQCTAYSSYVEEGRNDPAKAAFLRQRICKVDVAEVFICCPETPPTPSFNLIPLQIPSESQCGFRADATGIQSGAWPWIALLGPYEIDGQFKFVCHGTLVTNRHVLSAAHCFKFPQKKPIHVRLGKYDLESELKGEMPQDYQVILFNTDLFNRTTFANDIIVLPLDREVIFTDSIRPACLPFPYRTETFEGNHLILVGYGTTGGGQGSNVPIAALTPVVKVTECNAKYTGRQNILTIDESNICTGDGRAGSCRGDSGSGILYYDPLKNRYYVVGITSFGAPRCASEQYPDVNTRITHFLDWIEGQILPFKE